jgi:phosphate transport system permease protein
MSVSAIGPKGPTGQGDVPRPLDRGLQPSDRLFHGVSRGIAAVVFFITGAIGLFLFLQLVPTLHRYGWHFFTQANWDPQMPVPSGRDPRRHCRHL